MAGQNPEKNAEFPLKALWRYTKAAAKTVVSQFIAKVNHFMKAIGVTDAFNNVIKAMKTFQEKNPYVSQVINKLANKIPIAGGFTVGDIRAATSLFTRGFWDKEKWLFSWLVTAGFVPAFRDGKVDELKKASGACVALNGVVAFFAKLGILLGDPTIKTGGAAILTATKVVGHVCGNLVTVYLLSKKIATILTIARKAGWSHALRSIRA